jgi:hypothetical protein
LDGGKVQLNAFSRNHAPAVPFSADVELQAGDVVYVTGEEPTLGTAAFTCIANPECSLCFLCSGQHNVQARGASAAHTPCTGAARLRVWCDVYCLRRFCDCC